jgi:Helix-turn-helix domain
VTSLRLKWKLAVRDSRYDPTMKVVAFVLETYMDKDGYCWPGREAIAAGAGCDVRTVDRAIARLETAGFLRVHHSKGRKSNRYQATFPNRDTESPLNSGRESRLPGQRVAVTATLTTANGGTESPELVMTGSGKSSDNPPAHPTAETAAGGGQPEEEEDIESILNSPTIPDEVRDFMRRLKRGTLDVLGDVPL